LAVGATIEEAILLGALECVERDAYWVAMMIRPPLPSIDLGALEAENPELQQLMRACAESDLVVHAKNVQLDWPLPIVHILLEDRRGRFPAFSHGIAARPALGHAARKALLEALQVRSGLLLHLELQDHLTSVALPNPDGRPPQSAWSDPAYGKAISHFRTSGDAEPNPPPLPSYARVQDLVRAIATAGGKIFWSPLGELGGLFGVRVWIERCLPPDPLVVELDSDRVAAWLTRNGRTHPYCDPILT
jgi:hypothetical protein